MQVIHPSPHTGEPGQFQGWLSVWRCFSGWWACAMVTAGHRVRQRSNSSSDKNVLRSTPPAI